MVELVFENAAKRLLFDTRPLQGQATFLIKSFFSTRLNLRIPATQLLSNAGSEPVILNVVKVDHLEFLVVHREFHKSLIKPS